MVSSGWQASWAAAAPTRTRRAVSDVHPARACTTERRAPTHRLHRTGEAARSDVRGKPDGLLAVGPRHGKRWAPPSRRAVVVVVVVVVVSSRLRWLQTSGKRKAKGGGEEKRGQGFEQDRYKLLADIPTPRMRGSGNALARDLCVRMGLRREDPHCLRIRLLPPLNLLHTAHCLLSAT
ncbi:hypothetical protein DFH11DRAFT_1588229 [Phellopilus nigrolimitatus]|nr:hypothetical protein DFH11DRAFT_1588229 [Phellopilus nigrolimitatus]